MAFNELIVLPSLLKKLKQAGYQNMQQLIARKSTELKAEMNLEYNEIKQLIDACDREKGIIKRPFGSDLKAEQEFSFTTSSKKLDNMLLTGIPPTKITEICGESGSGKTQICMQLAINVQLPRHLGGAGGECIYIDTEGSFLTSRYTEMAKKHDVESMLNGLHFLRVLDHTELIAIIRQMHDIVKAYPKVKLIVIDSLAYHFRLNVLDAKSRGAILEFIARTLLEIAKKNDLAVVLTNHVTQAGDDAAWTPSLGGAWTYWLFNRMFLYRKRQFRFAYLYKAAGNKQDKPVQFCIKDEGIADPEEDELETEKTETEAQQEIDNKIDASWTELKEQHVKEQQDEEEQTRVDDFWDEAFLAEEFLSQLPPNVHQIKKEAYDNDRFIPNAIVENEGEDADTSNSAENQEQTEAEDDYEFILGSQVDEVPSPPPAEDVLQQPENLHTDDVFSNLSSLSTQEGVSNEGISSTSNSDNSNTSKGRAEKRKMDSISISYSPPIDNFNSKRRRKSADPTISPKVALHLSDNVTPSIVQQTTNHATNTTEINDGICTQICAATVRYDDDIQETAAGTQSLQNNNNPLSYQGYNYIPNSQRHLINNLTTTTSSPLRSSSNGLGKKSRDSSLNDTPNDKQAKKLKSSSTAGAQSSTSNVNNKETTYQVDWDSDVEEELDYAFLDEISSSL